MKYDIGFLGGGQLARMSIQAAQRMGLKCLSLDISDDTPASQIADNIVGPLADVALIESLLRDCDRLTLENEFIPASAIQDACGRASVPASRIVPSISCLSTIQDKLLQRQAYARNAAPSPTAAEIVGSPPLEFPLVLKARFGGYDGKGTRYAKTPEDFEQHRPLWSQGGWMAEEFVPFKRELAVMVCRSESQTICFPTMETVQTNHVCDLVFPANVDASAVAIKAVEAVEGYGLFGVELFETEDGKFLVNEIAPRPHNTGHYTLDWGGISQFEAHVRLVTGLPVPEPKGQETCMANLLGIDDPGDWRDGLRAAIEADPGIHVHWYGKAESRPGRKLGHLNVVGKDCKARAIAARERFYGAWSRA